MQISGFVDLDQADVIGRCNRLCENLISGHLRALKVFKALKPKMVHKLVVHKMVHKLVDRFVIKENHENFVLLISMR